MGDKKTTEKATEKLLNAVKFVKAAEVEHFDDVDNAEVEYRRSNKVSTIKLTLHQDWFEADSERYNHALCRLCSQFSMLGYCDEVEDSEKITGFEFTNPSLKNSLEAIGMSDIIINARTEYDQVNYFFANRKITVFGDEYTLVFAGMIGSHFKQWYSNFDSGTGNIHKGFNNARIYVYERLRKYIEALNADKKKTKLLLTGHSRGAATANLLAAQMIKDEIYVKKENIFTYTFATPNPTMLSERKDEEYKRIFNIVNPEDFVTYCMPELWGFGRYGTTLMLPNKDNSENFGKYLKDMNVFFVEFFDGQKFVPYKNGQKAVNKLIEGIYSEVKSVEEFYEKPLLCLGNKTTTQQYFSQSVCAIVGEHKGSPLIEKGTKLLLNTFMKRRETDVAIKSIADFFVLYEGIGSKTTGTISEQYFTYAHCSHAYCAFMLSLSEEELMQAQTNDIVIQADTEEAAPSKIKTFFKSLFKK